MITENIRCRSVLCVDVWTGGREWVKENGRPTDEANQVN